MPIPVIIVELMTLSAGIVLIGNALRSKMIVDSGLLWDAFLLTLGVFLAVGSIARLVTGVTS